jgi:hypothetical protein
VVVCGHRELADKDKCIFEEQMKNSYLRREIDMLKQERTRETWLLKNDLHNLEERLKEEKKVHQGRPFSFIEYFPLAGFLGR